MTVSHKNKKAEPHVSAIIVAAGKGLRMKGKTAKQYLSLAGRPVLSRTLAAFDACPVIDAVYLVVPEKDMDFCRERILPEAGLTLTVALVPGGRQRHDSVFRGLQAADNPGGIAVIHDGVRPLIRPEQITRCVKGAEEEGGCILGVRVADTLKSVDGAAYIRSTLQRKAVWSAQTPQAFPYDVIFRAHELAREKGRISHITDDAMLVEQSGKKVRIIEGSRYNLKITTREDLFLAEAILASGILKNP